MELIIAKDKFNNKSSDLLDYIERMIMVLKQPKGLLRLQFLLFENSSMVSMLKLDATIKLFLETNCSITAYTLRYIFSDDISNWKTTNDYNDIKDKEIYQISMGYEPYDIQHIITIYKGYILHSFYNKFKFEIVNLEDTKIEDFLCDDEILFYYYPIYTKLI